MKAISLKYSVRKKAYKVGEKDYDAYLANILIINLLTILFLKTNHGRIDKRIAYSGKLEREE